jgi:hypothetical protein
MWFEKALLMIAGAVAIFAATSRELTLTSIARASSLTGGDCGGCTTCLFLSTCQTCVDDMNCSGTGSYYMCQSSGTGSCVFCILGTSANGGITTAYAPGQCPTGMILVVVPDCVTGATYYPDATDNYSSKGSCPGNCG